MLWLGVRQQMSATVAFCCAGWGDPGCLTQEQGTACDSLSGGGPGAHCRP